MGPFRSWGGDRTGSVIVANQPFTHRFGYCDIEKDSIQLPNGLFVEGVSGISPADFLGIGTIAVAVGHAGDHFNNYVPVTVIEEEAGIVMTPYVDLEFNAYSFGETVGQLEKGRVRSIAAGIAIPYPELVTVKFTSQSA